MWVYKQTEPGLHTVGFYDPDGKWHPDSDGTKEECAQRVHYLNGGGVQAEQKLQELREYVTSPNAPNLVVLVSGDPVHEAYLELASMLLR